MDQHSVDALSSMIMIQLPFPCMPIVANRGDESSFCSSHDLLARAIAVRQVVGNTGGDYSEEFKQKQDIVCKLQQNISKIWTKHIEDNTDEIETIHKCYEIFQQSYREYIKLYPIFTSDLRFLPLSDVDNKSVIYKQAVSHLNSRLTLDSDIGDEGALTTYKIALRDNSYAAIIKAYILELTSYSSDE